MASGLQVWSKTPATNSTVDTNINFAEGQAPSSLNDSNRSMMASLANWRDDNNGTIVTGGSSTAFTATTNQVEAALTAGYTVRLQFHAAAESSATLAVDSLAAKPITLYSTTQLAGQEIQAGSIQNLTYSTSGTGQWTLSSYQKTIIPGLTFVQSTGISTNVTLTATANYYDGPSVVQGSTGIWFASGTITFSDPSGPARCFGKLWDGTNLIAAGANFIGVANASASVALSGIITNPTGNLRMSGKSNQVNTTVMTQFAEDSLQGATLTAIRIG